MRGVVVIGAGHAGVETAVSLRAGGYDGPVTVVGAEGRLPYQRPPLSKEVLADGGDPDALSLRSEEFFREQRITLCHGTAVDIDRGGRQVHVAGERPVDYDHVVLATGAARGGGAAQPRRRDRVARVAGGRAAGGGARRRVHRHGGGERGVQARPRGGGGRGRGPVAQEGGVVAGLGGGRGAPPRRGPAARVRATGPRPRCRVPPFTAPSPPRTRRSAARRRATR